MSLGVGFINLPYECWMHAHFCPLILGIIYIFDYYFTKSSPPHRNLMQQTQIPNELTDGGEQSPNITTLVQHDREEQCSS